MRIVLGTRGSDLARAQTCLVERALRAAHPDLEVAIVLITTSGDEKGGRLVEVLDQKAGRKGMFTAEIERALLDHRIDVAVHSAKDLPSETMAELAVCAALPRAAVEDVLVSKTSGRLAALPSGATIATGSVRRQHQLRAVRADLNLVDLRGNVPTRLRKLVENPWDGIVLARAGLERLGYDCAGNEIQFHEQTLRIELLADDRFIPAGGQGIVALEIRSDDAHTRQLLTAINDPDALQCLRAEREFLRLLQGDCGTPVGVQARREADEMILQAQVFADGECEPMTRCCRALFAASAPEALAAVLFQQMYGKEA